jgi:putative endonuclease
MAGGGGVSTHQEGRKGEILAAAFLRLKGYKILAKNFRVPHGEIDLIAQKGQTLVFVEVKMRRTKVQGSPLEAVSPHKVKRLSAAAACYLAKVPDGPPLARFDVVTLGPEKNFLGLLKIRHFENAFPADGNFNV